jgi:hypothetical protein
MVTHTKVVTTSACATALSAKRAVELAAAAVRSLLDRVRAAHMGAHARAT